MKVINYKLFTTEEESTKQVRLGFGMDRILIKREASEHQFVSICSLFNIVTPYL
jgi:hypothetical protein